MLALWLQRLVVVVLGVVYLCGPFVVPPGLSRRGYLSVSRWLIFAGTAMLAAVALCALFADAFRTPGSSWPMIYGLIGVPLFPAFFGCLVAAAIHPKLPPN